MTILGYCVTASSALAQQAPVLTKDDFRSPAEISVGVTMQTPADVNQPPYCLKLNLPCLSGRTFPDFGVEATAVGYISDRLGIVGEASAYRNLWFSNCCDVAVTNHVRTAQAGLRVRSALQDTGRDRWRYFGQILAGSEWSSVNPRGPAIQPGVGADVYLQNGVILHVQYDYCWVPGGVRDLSTGRLLIGMTFRIGSL
jgi:hypothetical protein